MTDSTAQQPIADVADTAFWVAHHRADESERPDALFVDPLARLLSGEKGRRIAHAMPSAEVTAWQVVVRTCVIDGFVREAVARGADAVLDLGAGMDTRPYRLDLPADFRWIEADQANVIELKERRLAGHRPRCLVERHGVDLANAAARRSLLAHVANRSRRVLVLTEGVVPYLTLEQAGALADDLRAEPALAQWVVDYISPDAVRHRERLAISKKMSAAPFRFTPSDWSAFFREHGWQATETRYLSEEGARLGRPFPAPLGLRVMLRMLSLFRRRDARAAIERAMGYALLHRTSAPP